MLRLEPRSSWHLLPSKAAITWLVCWQKTQAHRSHFQLTLHTCASSRPCLPRNCSGRLRRPRVRTPTSTGRPHRCLQRLQQPRQAGSSASRLTGCRVYSRKLCKLPVSHLPLVRTIVPQRLPPVLTLGTCCLLDITLLTHKHHPFTSLNTCVGIRMRAEPKLSSCTLRSCDARCTDSGVPRVKPAPLRLGRTGSSASDASSQRADSSAAGDTAPDAESAPLQRSLTEAAAPALAASAAAAPGAANAASPKLESAQAAAAAAAAFAAQRVPKWEKHTPQRPSSRLGQATDPESPQVRFGRPAFRRGSEASRTSGAAAAASPVTAAPPGPSPGAAAALAPARLLQPAYVPPEAHAAPTDAGPAAAAAPQAPPRRAYRPADLPAPPQQRQPPPGFGVPAQRQPGSQQQQPLPQVRQADGQPTSSAHPLAQARPQLKPYAPPTLSPHIQAATLPAAPGTPTAAFCFGSFDADESEAAPSAHPAAAAPAAPPVVQPSPVAEDLDPFAFLLGDEAPAAGVGPAPAPTAAQEQTRPAPASELQARAAAPAPAKAAVAVGPASAGSQQPRSATPQSAPPQGQGQPAGATSPQAQPSQREPRRTSSVAAAAAAAAAAAVAALRPLSKPAVPPAQTAAPRQAKQPRNDMSEQGKGSQPEVGQQSGRKADAAAAALALPLRMASGAEETRKPPPGPRGKAGWASKATVTASRRQASTCTMTALCCPS